jgi:predicted nuclease of restriction endonuclease-like (RecB) superfamily
MSKELSHNTQFTEVSELIAYAKLRAVQAVNSTLVDLYWHVGAIISQKVEVAEWGDGVVTQLAEYITKTHPNIRGFTRANLARMRQFYETYKDHEFPSFIANQELAALDEAEESSIVSPVVRQLDQTRKTLAIPALLRKLPWTHHMIIIGQSKRLEEREFYLKLAIKECWGKRELERQIKGALFERAVLNPLKVSPAVRQTHEEALSVFKDSYVVEFLNLPQEHAESDLHRGLLLKLKDFLIELGRDFCFVGSEFPIQVGGRDFALDLLFFHRGLNCLVAIELKVGRFEPEYLGKLSFYLEALDRDVKKDHEKPAIGVLLCASKDSEVVEYALNRTLTPALIAEYQTKLPDKKILQAKLHEFYLQNAKEEGDL